MRSVPIFVPLCVLRLEECDKAARIARTYHSSVTGGGIARHADSDAIIRTVVVPRVTKDESRHRADAAQFKRVILTRTHFPLVRCVDGGSSRLGGGLSEETPRQDRHWVLFVVDVRDLALHERVDKKS